MFAAAAAAADADAADAAADLLTLCSLRASRLYTPSNTWPSFSDKPSCPAQVLGHDSCTCCCSGDQNTGGEYGPASGAYIFRPDGEVAPDVHGMRVVRGPVVTEVHQVFSDYTSAIVRSASQMSV